MPATIRRNESGFFNTRSANPNPVPRRPGPRPRPSGRNATGLPGHRPSDPGRRTYTVCPQIRFDQGCGRRPGREGRMATARVAWAWCALTLVLAATAATLAFTNGAAPLPVVHLLF